MTADAVGGVWTYAMELARGLAPHRVQVDLAVMGPAPSDRQRAEAVALPNVTLHEADVRLEWMDDPWNDVGRAGEWLLGLARTTGPDLVHLNGYVHGALPWRVPVVVVAHSCVLSWWRAVKGEDAPAAWDRYREHVAAGVHAARVVVAPTRAMLDEIGRWYGAPPASRVVPNGRRAAEFPPGAKEPIVLTAGRLWDEAKNVRAVARAARDLSTMVFVAGDQTAPDREGTHGAAHAPPAGVPHGDRVRWLGRLAQGDMAAWMARAAVYALPASYEPFGLSALEAALAGCALVLGDVASLREVWGDAARYVDPHDATALAATLTRLTSDADARERCARACRMRALTYTPERMVAGYLDVYALAADRWHGARSDGATRRAAVDTEVPCAR